MLNMKRRDLFTGAAALTAASALAPLVSRTAHAAAPAGGSTNGGWYRYKVGDFEVTVVADGVGATPLADSYVVNAQKADVNAQLGLRHVGGLSAVDQLVGTGLENINDNTARLTFPISVGVRFRFK